MNLFKKTKNTSGFLFFNRHLHTWLGLAVSIVALTFSVTGIMLNHQPSLGLVPEVKHEATGQISQSLPMDKVVMIAIQAADNKDITSVKDVELIEYRTDDVYAKVKFKDKSRAMVMVDLVTGEVLNSGVRHDMYPFKIHTGGIFGDNFVVITDIAAVALILITFSGFYIWIYPKWRRHSIVS